MKILQNYKTKGICLIAALILFLLALLAAGFVFYAGRCIITWLNELGHQREEQLNNASEITNTTARMEFLPFFASK